MATRVSGFERKARDFYPTPAWVTQALIEMCPLPENIWEPACGDGHMSEELAKTGADVYSSDLVTSYGDPGIDFLKEVEMPEGFTGIITNPPFNKMAERFIRHALLLTKPVDGFVAMLLPVTFDSGKTRRDIFGNCTAFNETIKLTSRIVWFEREDGKKVNPADNHAWFVWDWATPTCMPSTRYHYRD